MTCNKKFVATSNPTEEKIVNPEGRAICAQIAARLRELADKIDDACSPPDSLP
jgi:hypothetical protein